MTEMRRTGRRRRIAPRLVERGPDEKRWEEPTLGVTDVVRQHYVPRFYLEGFTSGDGMVDALDLDQAKSFRGRPESVGYDKNFNNVGRLEGGEAVSTEPWLTEIEDDAARLLLSLRDDPDLISSLSQDDQRTLARYFVAQSFRVPAFREQHAGMQRQLAEQTRAMIKHAAMTTMGMTDEEAEAYIEEHSKTEDGWLLNTERDKHHEAWLTSSMLEGVEGFANLLRGMPWRIGVTAMDLYTSDNPMAGLARRGDPFGGAFGAQTYYFPVSRRVLLVMGPLTYDGEPSLEGKRQRRDFSECETSVARHVVSMRATRFLYGPAPYVDRECAVRCLRKIQQAQLEDSVRYQNLDSTAPWTNPSLMRRFQPEDPPNFEGLHRALWEYENRRVPASHLIRWIDELAFIAEQPSCKPGRKQRILDFLIALTSPGERVLNLSSAVAELRRDLQWDAMSDYMQRTGESFADMLEHTLSLRKSGYA